MKRTTLRNPLFVGALLISAFCLAPVVQSVAQSDAEGVEGPVLVGEGVVGDVDNHRRSPQVSVQSVNFPDKTKILVDVAFPNSRFAKYPVQVGYYVNRTFVTSQIRSVELPGPLGIDVPIATPRPFNYAIVAKILHQNREYKTVVQAVAEEQIVTAVSYDCSVSLAAAEETTDEFQANDVQISKSGETAFNSTFGAQPLESAVTSGEISIALSFVKGTQSADSTSDFDATGSADITRNGTKTNSALTGTVSFEGTNLTAIDLHSEDESVVISCQ